MSKVIRITRHPIEAGRLATLQRAYREDVSVVDDDVPYGDDPVKTVVNLIAKHGGNVVALEVVAPIPVLAKLVQAKRELGGIHILRAEFTRGADGRAQVVGQDAAGRDVFGFSHYEVIKEVRVVTERL